MKLGIGFAIAVMIAAGSSSYAAVPVPLQGDRPVALDQVRVKNPAVLPLAGPWRFQLTHGFIAADGFHGIRGPATASSAQDGHFPADALEGQGPDARWCAESGDFPQWWMVDLQKPEDVRALSITWEFKEALYRFKVEGSGDGRRWELLADRTALPGVHDGPAAIPPRTLRFLRITIVGARSPNADAWPCIRHVGITVLRNGQETAWTPPTATEDLSQRDAFARLDYPETGWSRIPVPANWEMEGFSRPTYNNPDDAVGLYRRRVQVPASFSGKRILWHFDGVNNGAEIFINGQPIAYHESGFTAFDVDVTDALKPGAENLLALRVSKRTPSVDLDTGDYWCLGGIYRENYLVALPAAHVHDLTVVTDLDSLYRDAALRTAVQVAGPAGSPVSLHGSLFTAGGAVVPGVELSGESQIGADGAVTVPLQATVASPALWSAEKPNLYYLFLTLSRGGQVVERVQERFGFRKIEIKGGVVLWNGTPVKCTGTCRHEEWAAYGHALTEQCWRTDLQLMKGCNINAVRTSHYNHAARFLELCDEMGIYVLDEVPGCWCDVHDPKLMGAFIQRTRETLERDKDRPCVLAWSLGNESGYGPNNQAMFDFAKANDPTRPAFISQCGPWNNPRIDFADTHYPSIRDVRRMATEPLRSTTPLVMTEQPHIFYVRDGLDYDYGEKDLWGQVLASNWSVVWPTDSILGSFIWEWQDQGIADRFPDRTGVDASGLRNNNYKGIVDGYRHPKPEYWNIKMVYSPVVTSAQEVAPSEGKCVVRLQNRYSFTDLSELSCRWQALREGRQITSGETRAACPPRASADASFPAPAGMDTLRLEFIHPDGRSIYVTRLHVKGASRPAPPPARAAAAVRLSNAGSDIQVDAGGGRLLVDGNSGAIRSWTFGGRNLMMGGPILNLGEQRQNHGDHGARNFVESKSAPQFQNVVVHSEMKEAAARVTVTADVFLVESTELKGRLTYTLDVHPDAEIDVVWALDWLAANANAWELGMKLVLPPAVHKMSWLRSGLWTEYPPNHIGAVEGTVNSSDPSFRTTKRDVQWLTLSGAGSALAVLEAGPPLHTRAHAEKDRVVAYLSSEVAPPYDFSTSLAPELLIHLTRGQTFGGAFRLRAAQGR